MTKDDTAQTVVGLTGANSAINVSLLDAATAPSSYDGNKYVVVQESALGSENYHLVDNAYNIALAGGSDNTTNIPQDIDGDTISGSQNQIGPDYIADTTAPVVNEVYITQTDGTTTKADGSYNAGETMSFIVEFSQVITVTGSPELSINSSGTALSCSAHSSLWNALKCDYTVGASDNSADLDYSNTTALALSGATITDKAGNSATLTLPTPNATYSASDNQAIVIDTGVPTVAITSSPVINLANHTAYTISGTCSEATRNVSYDIGGITGTTACSGGNTWSVTEDVNTVGDSATVSITADHDDAAGNNATQATASVVKDTVRPTPLTLTSPANGSSLNNVSQTMTGTCETGATVDISGAGITGTPSGSCTSGSYSISVTLTAGDGAKAYSIDQSDAAGNSMATPVTGSYTLDTGAPTVAITSSPVINLANHTAYTISGTCSEATRNVSYDIGGITGTTACTGGNTWSVTEDVNTVGDSATISITADHDDAAGNNAVQSSVNVVKDTVRPTPLTLTSPANGSSLNNVSQTMAGTCETGATVDISGAGITGTPSGSCTAGSYSISVTLTTGDGAKAYSIDQTDAAGNSMATPVTGSYTLDTGVPTVAITSSPVINLANHTAYTVSGTCSEATRNVSYDIGGITGTTACSGANTWSVTEDVNTVGDSATVSITADHDDAAGNNATQATASVLKDTIRPTPLTLTSPAASSTVSSTSQTMVGTCETGATVDISGAGIIGTPSGSCTAGSYSIAVTLTAGDGAKAYSIDQTDAANNSMAAPLTGSYTLSTVSAAAPVYISAVSGTFISSGSLSVTTSGSNRLLVVSVSTYGSGTPITSMDYNGRNLTLLEDIRPGTFETNHIYYLASPDSGTHNLNVNVSTGSVSLNAVVFENVDTVDPFGTVTENGTASGTTISANLSVDYDQKGFVSFMSASDNASYSFTPSADESSSSAFVLVDNYSLVYNGPGSGTTVVNPSLDTVSTSEDLAMITVPINGYIARETVTNVTSAKTNGNYTEGEVIDIDVTFSDNITVNTTGGTPYLLIDVGGGITAQANYISSSTNTATFRYTVAKGNRSSDLAYSSDAALVLNGGTIKDPGSVDVNPALPAPGTSNSLSNNKALVIYTLTPYLANTTSYDHESGFANSFSFSATTSGDYRLLVVSFHERSDEDITGLTYNGVALTQLGTITGSSSSARTSVWYLINPALGSNTLAGTLSSNSSNFDVQVQAFANVHQVSPFGTVNTETHNGSSNATLSVNSNELGYVAVSSRNTFADSTSPLSYYTEFDSYLSLLSSRTSLYYGSGALNPDFTFTTNRSSSVSVPIAGPLVPTLTSSSFVNSTSETITGACETGSDISIDGAGIVSGPYTGSCTAESYSIVVTLTAGEGSKAFTVSQSDGGIPISDSFATSVTLDTTIPTVTINATTAINLSNYTAYTISGTCSEAGQTISYNIGGVAGTTTCTGGNTWSATVDVNTVGDNLAVSITVDHDDAAGNSATQATDTVLKDTVAPTGLTQTGVADSTVVTSRVITVSGACENGATVKVTGDIETDLGPFEVACSSSAWILSIALSRANGAKNISFDQEDAAGNTQASDIDHTYTFNRRSHIAQKVGPGRDFTCFLHTNGKILCSGQDQNYGKTGTGQSRYQHFSPVEVDMSAHTDTNNFTQLDSNYYSSCAVNTSGKVYCWGRNQRGQLGDAGTSTNYTPDEIDMSTAGVTNSFSQVSISPGYEAHGCGVHTNQKVYCWGDPNQGSLGEGSTGSTLMKPVEIDMSGTSYSNTFLDVSAGVQTSCGVHTTGRVFCWGDAFGGKLGHGTATDSTTPIQIDMSAQGLYDNDYIQVSAGYNHVCGVHSSGRIYCWGKDDDDFSVTGQGSLSTLYYPTQIDMSLQAEDNDFNQVRAGAWTTCATHSNGKAFCWGDNNYGQLGLGNFTGQNRPEPIVMSHIPLTNSFSQIAGSWYNTCGLHTSNAFYCVGNNQAGQLGTGEVDYEYDFTEPDMSSHTETNNFNKVSVGHKTTCGIHTGGKVFCWGDNDRGQVGSSSTADYINTPVEIDMSAHSDNNNFSEIDVGTIRTCGIHASSQKAYCWGDCDIGLGISCTSTRTAPVEVDMSAHTESNTFSKITTVERAVCGIHTGGKVFCWGENSDGELGDGNNPTTSLTPVEIDMSAHSDSNNFSEISGGNATFYAIHATSQKLYIWGEKWAGALGDGNSASGTQATPVEVNMGSTGVANTFLKVSGSLGGAAAIHTNNKVYTWGYGTTTGRNLYGSAEQMGEIDMSAFTETNNFRGLSDAGYQNSYWVTCGIHDNNKIFCWGRHANEAWGTQPSTPDQARTWGSQGITPYEMEFTSEGLSNFALTGSSGDSHMCIILRVVSDPKLFCAGSNTYGQLGNGFNVYRNQMQAVDMTNF